MPPQSFFKCTFRYVKFTHCAGLGAPIGFGLSWDTFQTLGASSDKLRFPERHGLDKIGKLALMKFKEVEATKKSPQTSRQVGKPSTCSFRCRSHTHNFLPSLLGELNRFLHMTCGNGQTPKLSLGSIVKPDCHYQVGLACLRTRFLRHWPWPPHDHGLKLYI